VLVGEARNWVQDLVAKAKTLKVSGGTVRPTSVRSFPAAPASAWKA
jgi:malonate-semialdehyde dehydrogenase (acetylating)/methylmalonate-semialdehyde dehydrogenase